MNRIDDIFKSLRDDGRKGLMPYLTAGDPNLEGTAAMLKAIDDAGATTIEVGFPFSDPIADGPTIQASMTYALDQGLKIAGIFQTVREVRDQIKAGLVAMVSFSMVHRYGVDRFCKEAAAAGFDGLIIPDLALEAVDTVRPAAESHGLILSLLIAPTTGPQRARAIAKACSGFVYVVSRSGITGERATLPAELPDRLRQLREVTDLSLAVGFGIAGPDQVREVVQVADAAIVGSALVRRVMDHRDARTSQLASVVGGFVSELREGLP